MLRHIALLLLLLFCRAMVPDALLLELHPHTHTVHSDSTDLKKAQVGMKHKHCVVEDVFDTPFLGTLTSLYFVPVVHTTAYAASYINSEQGFLLSQQYLRGPPKA
ncbi:hypothetical protein [Pontibacter saemangeumensis]|uniref:hypothetical protein n=1 Tax=Pontibacter saemangeumensis TaxID=1084525 RepID=UPI0031F0BB36